MGQNSADLRRRIADAWAHGAHEYDQDPGHGLVTPLVERVWTDLLAELLGDEPRQVLDVGTGTGFLAVMLAGLGHRATGADLTPAMLVRAQARAASAGRAVAWARADAMALPFADSCFDVVISRHVLWTMTDPADAFREWIRVTHVGGQVSWFDGLWPAGGWTVRARQRAAEVVRRLQWRPDHAAAHHYPEALNQRLPLRNIQTVAPVREVLLRLGVEQPQFRDLPALERVERAAQPLHRRIRKTGGRYLGRFTVTDAIKRRAASQPL